MLDLISRNRRTDLYDALFSDFFPETYNGNAMRADIRESDTHYTIDVEIPGVAKENIRLITNDDILTINVKREESAEENEKYLRKERCFGSLSRAFTIRDIDKDSISAKYSDGVLHIYLPKAKNLETNRAKTINIE